MDINCWKIIKYGNNCVLFCIDWRWKFDGVRVIKIFMVGNFIYMCYYNKVDFLSFFVLNECNDSVLFLFRILNVYILVLLLKDFYFNCMIVNFFL